MNSQDNRNVKASSASTTASCRRGRRDRTAARAAARSRARHSRARTGSRSARRDRSRSRKKADSASRRKCAPSHGTPSGSVMLSTARRREQMRSRRQRAKPPSTIEAGAVDDARRRRRAADHHGERRERRAAPRRRQGRSSASRVAAPLEPHAAAAALAWRIVGDELDAERVERGRRASSANRRCRGSRPRSPPCAGWSAATARPPPQACAGRCREVRARLAAGRR